MQFAFMNDDEKITWIQIMKIIDKEFKDNENSDA